MFGDRAEASRLPVITPNLVDQISRVEASVDPLLSPSLLHRPCRVQLRSGEWRDHVYVQEATSWVRMWGVWPWEGAGRDSIAIDEVVAVEESPTRIPVRFANQIYSHGESGMGYCIFTLELANGRKLACLTGNVVDWVDLPIDVTPDQIVRVFPGEGRDAVNRGERCENSPHFWCLYRDEG